MIDPARLDEHHVRLLDWLHTRALGDWDVPTLQEELIAHLTSFGMDFYRMHIGLPMLHPLYRVGANT